MSEKRWWLLDQKGNPVTNFDGIVRPSNACTVIEGCEEATPWFELYNHLHCKRGQKGIHFFGTFEEAVLELKKAWRGESKLPVRDPEFVPPMPPPAPRVPPMPPKAVLKQTEERELPKLENAKFIVSFKDPDRGGLVEDFDAKRILEDNGIDIENNPYFVQMLKEKMQDLVIEKLGNTEQIDFEFDLNEKRFKLL